MNELTVLPEDENACLILFKMGNCPLQSYGQYNTPSPNVYCGHQVELDAAVWSAAEFYTTFQKLIETNFLVMTEVK